MLDRLFHILLFVIGFILGGGVMYLYAIINGGLPGQK